MTDSAMAAALVRVQVLERDARVHWDALSDGSDGLEYQAAMGVVGKPARYAKPWSSGS